MSNSSPVGPKSDKAMSSRLLTMKFMQRAAASNAAKEESSDAGEGSQTPKRPRLSTEKSSPATPQSDLEAISAAIAAEEEKRRSAIARQAAEAGETEWFLDVPASTPVPPRPIVVAAESFDTEDNASSGGRRAFGNFKRKKTATQIASEEREAQAKANAEKEKRNPKAQKLSTISSRGGGGGGGGGGSRGLSAQDQLKKKKKRQSQ